MAGKTPNAYVKSKSPPAPEGTREWLEFWLAKYESTRDRFKKLHKQYPNAYTKNQWWYYRDAAAVTKHLIWLALPTKERSQSRK